ncbi:NAD(P)H-dependent oxidoreductase [Bacteroidetes bacterium endosymbiont of Geopemphigus sp.]|uniref:NAD(P)H-dependent oxidoreductase n=1 Tax=Bacteroidetes bacterium endosymbiont of Geopemphigus sp. TaxID=2047937 RepID=UPI000CD229F7|nr:NAD(P)H-dependent oxidoreductase [Bacteroidetes bacterium endosymbiont of Geopemphigus sp.]
MNTLLLLAHPNLESSISNRRIIETISSLKDVEVHSLYNLYADKKIDVAAEQESLVKSDLIIFQFPMFWFSAPPILKTWQDQVLSPGFGFGAAQEDFKLKGKNLLLSITTGGKREKYHVGNSYNYTLDETLRPLQMMVNYCKMTYKGYIQSNGRPFTEKEDLDKEIINHTEKLIAFIKDF